MKTLKILALFFLTAFSLSSCKKDYTCKCTYVYMSMTTWTNGEYKSKGAADTWCKSLGQNGSDNSNCVIFCD